MAAYNEVFKRIEKKYRVLPAQRAAVEAALAGRLAPDGYGRSAITSVYWDTPELSLISRSLEKPCYKEKLRVRAYGPAAGDALVAACLRGKPAEGDGAQLVFFELKKKFKRVVYKRRIGLSLDALFALLGGTPYEEAVAAHPSASPEVNQLAASALNRQIARELLAAMGRYEAMAPSIAIRCERTAWAPCAALEVAGCETVETAETAAPLPPMAAEPEGPYAQLRVTFDDSLRFFDMRGADARCEAGALPWRPVVDGAIAIMELKNAGPLPLEFAALLSKHDIFPASFSKYGTAYQLTAHEKGMIPGLDCVFGRAAGEKGVGLPARASHGGVAAAMGAAVPAKTACPAHAGVPAASRTVLPPASAPAAPARRFGLFRFPLRKKGARCA